MKLQLHNILKIEHADIEIGGLTVLTGENNSGKSTVGKVLFSILKAANNARQIDRMKAVSQIRARLALLKKMFDKSTDLSILDDIQSLSVSLADRTTALDELSQTFENEAVRLEFSSRMTAIMRKRLVNIENLVLKLDNPEIAICEEFEAIARSEFMEPLNTFGKDDSCIMFHDDTSGAGGGDMEIKIRDGKVRDVSLNGSFSLEDITYVESPVYLPILNTLRLSSTIPTNSMRGLPYSMRRDNVPYHLADMAEKILSAAEEYPTLFNEEAYGLDFHKELNDISSAIGGEFVLNGKTRQLSFNQDGHAVPPVSVASGIKSFGVLQRLIQTGDISTFRMLVWDEPEIHLHPEWQIVFCRLIIELVAKGIPIVVSSHSPYFVQALRYFASAKGIEKDVRYYMAEESEQTKLSMIREVTDDLNRVFTLLAAPLRDIMNVDAVRNSMK